MGDSAPNSRPAGIRRSATYLAEIESLRGIAMLLVYVFHLNAHVEGAMRPGEAESMSLAWAFIRAGHTGVSLFFVLSGFLLSLPFLGERVGQPRVRVRTFYTRRALRILPLYYTAVVVGTVMTATHLADLWRALPYMAFLNLVPGWTISLYPYSSTWWSLATEVQYYLILPLLPLVWRSRVGGIITALLFLVYAAAFTTYVRGDWHLSSILGNMGLKLSLFGRAPLFLCGIAVAWVYVHWGPRLRASLAPSSWANKGGADACFLLVLLALGYVLRWTLRQGYAAAEALTNFAWHIPEGLLWASILGLILVAPLRLRPLISNRIFGHLGLLSYSMYLWHTVAISEVPKALFRAGWRWQPRWNPQTVAIALVITAVSLIVSQLTYTLIERPFLLRKARVE